VADDIVKADAEIRHVLPVHRLRAGQVVGLADLDEVATTNALHELVAKMGSAPWLWSRCCPGAASSACSRCAGPSATSSTASRRPARAGRQPDRGRARVGLRLEEAERAAGEARAVFYAIADGVLLTDPFGRVTAMNRALEALTGWTEAEARGRPYAEVLPIATDQVGGPADLVSRYGRKVPVAVSSARSSTPGAGSSAGST
jgi:PAS domain-containing protein